MWVHGPGGDRGHGTAARSVKQRAGTRRISEAPHCSVDRLNSAEGGAESNREGTGMGGQGQAAGSTGSPVSAQGRPPLHRVLANSRGSGPPHQRGLDLTRATHIG